MKTIRLLCAAVLSLAAWSNAPAEPKPLAAWSNAAAEPKPLPLLLAQRRTLAKCELDGRMLPEGKVLCLEGKFKVCNSYGTWESTGKDC